MQPYSTAVQRCSRDRPKNLIQISIDYIVPTIIDSKLRHFVANSVADPQIRRFYPVRQPSLQYIQNDYLRRCWRIPIRTAHVWEDRNSLDDADFLVNFHRIRWRNSFQCRLICNEVDSQPSRDIELRWLYSAIQQDLSRRRQRSPQIVAESIHPAVTIQAVSVRRSLLFRSTQCPCHDIELQHFQLQQELCFQEWTHL